MLRWWWRFYHCRDFLWDCIIKSLYDLDGGCRSLFTRRVGTCPWSRFIRMFIQLKGRGIDIQYLCAIKIVDGRYTSFWKDLWICEYLLESTFHRVHALDTFRHLNVSDKMFKGWEMTTLRRNPRGGVEQEQLDGLLSIIQNIQLQSVPNRLGWVIATRGTFSISSACGFIDGSLWRIGHFLDYL